MELLGVIQLDKVFRQTAYSDVCIILDLFNLLVVLKGLLTELCLLGSLNHVFRDLGDVLVEPQLNVV